MERKNQIYKLIICLALIIGVIIYRKLEPKHEPKKITEIFTNETTEITTKKPDEKENQQDDTKYTYENFPEQIVNEDDYDSNAYDGESDLAYFTNGNVLYENKNIPLEVYVNQMEYITNYCNLHFEDKINGITILEDSVEVNNTTLKYACDLNNEHYLYVTCDLKTISFTFTDSPKFD